MRKKTQTGLDYCHVLYQMYLYYCYIGFRDWRMPTILYRFIWAVIPRAGTRYLGVLLPCHAKPCLAMYAILSCCTLYSSAKGLWSNSWAHGLVYLTIPSQTKPCYNTMTRQAKYAILFYAMTALYWLSCVYYNISLVITIRWSANLSICLYMCLSIFLFVYR